MLTQNIEIISVGDLTNPDGYEILDVWFTTNEDGAAIIAEVAMPDGERRRTYLTSNFVRELGHADLVEMRSGGYYIRCIEKQGRSYKVEIYKK